LYNPEHDLYNYDHYVAYYFHKQLTIIGFGKRLSFCVPYLKDTLHEDFPSPCFMVHTVGYLLAAGTCHVISFSPCMVSSASLSDCWAYHWASVQIRKCSITFPIPGDGR
jgi:hypothetical protein